MIQILKHEKSFPNKIQTGDRGKNQKLTNFQKTILLIALMLEALFESDKLKQMYSFT